LVDLGNLYLVQNFQNVSLKSPILETPVLLAKNAGRQWWLKRLKKGKLSSVVPNGPPAILRVGGNPRR